MKLYGIKNCDTIKKARAWLTQRGVAVPFHDFKTDGTTPALVNHWEKAVGWETLINRKGTTWRTLPDELRNGVTDAKTAKQLMLDKPTVIKRPVLEIGDAVHIGFTPAAYEALFTGLAEDR